MRDEAVKREAYFIVEATDRKGKVVYKGTFTNFEQAYEKYYSFKGRNGVLLQRKFKEHKVA